MPIPPLSKSPLFSSLPSYRANESRFRSCEGERKRKAALALDLDTRPSSISREITFLKSLQRIFEESLS